MKNGEVYKMPNDDQRVRQLYEGIKAGKIAPSTLTASDKAAVKAMAALNIRKTTSAEKPLTATMQGQQQLQRQADVTRASQALSLPKPAPQVQQVTQEQPKTWGEMFAEAYPNAAKALGTTASFVNNALLRDPVTGIKLTSAANVPSAVLTDVVANLSDVTGAKTPSNPFALFGQGVSDYFSNVGKQDPNKSWYEINPNPLGGALSAGYENIADKSRQASDISKNIAAYSAQKFAGATPEQAQRAADVFAQQYPNAAGISANLISNYLDPVELVGGAKIPKMLEKLLPKKLSKQALSDLQILSQDLAQAKKGMNALDYANYEKMRQTEYANKYGNVQVPTFKQAVPVSPSKGTSAKPVGALPQPFIDVTPAQEPNIQYGQPYQAPEYSLPEPQAGTRTYGQTEPNRFPAQPNVGNVPNQPVITPESVASSWREQVGQEARNAPLGLPQPVDVPKKGVKVSKVVNSPKQIQEYYKNKMDQLAEILRQKYPNVPFNTLTQQEIENEWANIASKSDHNFADAFELAYPEEKGLQKKQIKNAINRFGNIDNLNEALQKGKSSAQVATEQQPLIFKTQKTKFLSKGNVADQVAEDLKPPVQRKTRGRKPVSEQPKPIVEQVGEALGETKKTENVQQTVEPVKKLTKEEKKKTKDLLQRHAFLDDAIRSSNFIDSSEVSSSLITALKKIVSESKAGGDFLKGSKVISEIESAIKRGTLTKKEYIRISDMLDDHLKELGIEKYGKDFVGKRFDATEGMEGVGAVTSEEAYKKYGKRFNNYDVVEVIQGYVDTTTGKPIANAKVVYVLDPKGESPKNLADKIGEDLGGKKTEEQVTAKSEEPAVKQTKQSAKEELLKKIEQAKEKFADDPKGHTDFAEKALKEFVDTHGKLDAGTVKKITQMIESSSEKKKQPTTNRTKSADEQIRENNQKLAESEQSRIGIVSGGGISLGKTAEAKTPKTKTDVALSSTAGKDSLFDKVREIPAKTIEALKNAMNTVKAYGKIDNNRVKEILFDAGSEVSQARNKGVTDVDNITTPLKYVDPYTKTKGTDYELFKNILLLRDYEETLLRSEKAKVPNDLSLDDVQKRLKESEKKLASNERVQTALKNYYLKMKEVYDDLVARGKLPEDDNPREYYVPHRVLEYYEGKAVYEGNRKLDTPYRFYTEARKGSERLIETDVKKVMEDFFTKVYADNAVEDAANLITKETDILKTVNTSEMSRARDRKLIQLAKRANAKYVTYDDFTEPIMDDLIKQGVDSKEAKKLAHAAWVSRADLTQYEVFQRNVKSILKGELLDNKQLPQLTKQLWNNVAKTNYDLAREVDGKIINYDGKQYVLHNKRYTSEVSLIPKEVYDAMKEFSEPLVESKLGRALHATTGAFKAAAMVPTTPARITVDAISNAKKFIEMDKRALTKIGTAARLFLRTSSLNSSTFPYVADLMKFLAEKPFGKPTAFDNEVLKFAIDNKVIEPVQRVRGMYKFTNPIEKAFRAFAGVPIYSKNASQRVDEFFKLMKLASDLDRIDKGDFVRVTRKNGRQFDPTGTVDITGLDNEAAVTKVAKEFTVNPNRQSRFMRKYLTSFLTPFLHWAATDSLHKIRNIRANPLKATAQILGATAFFEIWNNTSGRDKVEEQLSPEKRAIPHMITGYADESGKPYILYFPTFSGTNLFQATGLSMVPQQFTEIIKGSKDPSKALDDFLHQASKSSVRALESYLTPYVRVPAELYKNQNMYTGLPIVPSSKTGTSEELGIKAKYALEQSVPQYKSFTSALASDQTGSVSDYVKKLINPLDRILKQVDLKKEGKIMQYDLEGRELVRDKEAKQKLFNSFIDDMMLGKNRDKFIKAAVDSGLSSDVIDSYIQSNIPSLLSEAIKRTKDPNKKAEMQKQLDALNKQKASKKVENTSVENQKEAKRLYEQQYGGVK